MNYRYLNLDTKQRVADEAAVVAEMDGGDYYRMEFQHPKLKDTTVVVVSRGEFSLTHAQRANSRQDMLDTCVPELSPDMSNLVYVPPSAEQMAERGVVDATPTA